MNVRIIAQIVAIAAGAVLTFSVGSNYSEAASAWQLGVQVEMGRAGADLDQVRSVYADEGPVAYRGTVARIRADELTAPAETDATARTQRDIAVQLARALDGAGSLPTRYGRPSGGWDLTGRLADIRAGQASVPRPDLIGEGDRLARVARDTALATAVITGLFAAGACVRRRRPAATEPVEFVPLPALASPAQRRASYVLLIIWVAGVLIPLAQLRFSNEEQRHQANAARYGVLARSDESISRTRMEFAVTAQQIATEAGIAATARELSGSVQGSGDPSAEALPAPARADEAAARLARAEEAAARRGILVAKEMAQVPSDAPLARALTSRPEDWRRLMDLSLSENVKADRASSVANFLLALIAVVALAGPVVQYRAKSRAPAEPAIPEPPAAPAPAPAARALAPAAAALAMAPAAPGSAPAAAAAALTHAPVPAAPPAGPPFLAGLVAGSAAGMTAAWWFARRRRRSRRRAG